MIMSMNPEVKKKWVAALRSNEYLQCKYKLKKSTGFCCLGVLCDVHAKEFNKDSWIVDGCNKYNNHDETLPDVVCEWAGLIAGSASISPSLAYFRVGEYIDKDDNNIRKTLADLNDEKGKNFNEIADVIEKYF